METEEWFKLKRYPHIGKPLTLKDYQWVKEYVESPDQIRQHSFLPLIYKSIVTRRYRADVTKSYRTKKGERCRLIDKPKVRHIYYASHLDSMVFSYYNYILSCMYEKYIEDKTFVDSIVAYRRIPVEEGSKNNKSNIEFARSTFEHIINNKGKNLTVIVADVTKFFDTLDHKILKKQWSKILAEQSLPRDHYNVFKALTNLRYVKGDQLFEAYGKTMLIEGGLPNSSKKEIKRKGIKSIFYAKEKNAVAYCSKDEFLAQNLNLIIPGIEKKGIPQGSPISATLANVYMLDFDQQVFDKVHAVGGYYQRYSDDLVIVCEQEYEDDMLEFIRNRISKLAKLEIHPEKTLVYRFETIGDKTRGFEIDEKTKVPNYNKTLEYLGFSFDGERVLIKSAGFSKYYRTMKRSFKKSTSLAIYSKNPDTRIFKSRLYKRFTHVGAERRKKYRPSKSDPTKYEETRIYDWGNYLSYVNKANDSMRSLNKSDAIKRQGRRTWRRFHRLMSFHQSRLKVEEDFTGGEKNIKP